MNPLPSRHTTARNRCVSAPKRLITRIAIACVVALAAMATTPAQGTAQDLSRACYLGFGALNRLPDLRSSSGNPRLDRAMIAEIRKVDRVFGISPAYSFFRDASANAFATPEQLVDFPGTRGTVAFGLNLVESELSAEYGGGVRGCPHLRKEILTVMARR